jgi:hypothetical protein
MASFRGTVKLNDLEGGFWELHAEDGKRYQLQGSDAALDPDLTQDGARVEIEGKIDRAAFGIGMTGPVLSVRSFKRLD